MYVMQTRSKSSLTYVTSDGWEEDVHTKPSLAYTPASEFADEIPF
jgi:hypothetical protein